jgi:hypothetical protein
MPQRKLSSSAVQLQLGMPGFPRQRSVTFRSGVGNPTAIEVAMLEAVNHLDSRYV